MRATCATCGLPVATNADIPKCPTDCEGCETCRSLCWIDFNGHCYTPKERWVKRDRLGDFEALASLVSDLRKAQKTKSEGTPARVIQREQALLKALLALFPEGEEG